MMMMKAVVLVVAVIASSVHVVQGQTSDPCDGLSKNQCKKKKECTYIFNTCFSTAGKGSVVRQGDNNVAPGKYCAVGGGKRNQAGDINDTYNVVGGGDFNYLVQGSKNTISGGKFNAIKGGGDVQEFDTISGGWQNSIFKSSYSVITGGGGEGDGFGKSNSISGVDTSTISGGSQNLIQGSGTSTSSHNTITGGFDNILNFGGNGAITGGFQNGLFGRGAVVAGGASNFVSGSNSLAFGQSVVTTFDHSMVVNLIGGRPLEDTEEGEFLMYANSFRFQIGNGKGKGGLDLSTTITKQNIPYLRAALDEE